MEADLYQLALDQNWERLRTEVSTRPYSVDDLTAALVKAVFFEHLEMAAFLLSVGADPNRSFDGSEYPAMNAAIENAWRPGLELLLVNGGDVNVRSFGEWTPLMLAVVNEAEGTVQTGELRTVDFLCFLLEQGADPSLRNAEGLTAVDYARIFDWSEAVQLLTEARWLTWQDWH